MRASNAQNYPEYEDETKQEAARFLVCDIDARPVIRGIEDIDRLDAWTTVAKALDVEGRQRRALRQRWQALNTADEEIAFERASEIDTDAEAAVADGGAVVEDDASGETAGDRELGPDQEQMAYADEAEFESRKNEWRGFVFSETYDTVEAVKDQLDEEFQRDQVRPHVVELLQERLEDLEQ